MVRETLILAVACVASAQVAWPAAGPELCVVPSTLPVRPDSTCADFGHGASCENPTVRLAAQRGETESAQLLLRRGSDMDSRGGLTNVRVSVGGLPTGVASAEVFQVGYVFARHSPRYEGSGGGWRPDPLLPVPGAGAGFDVSPDQAQGIWLEVSVAASAPAGTYQGTIQMSCDADACKDLKVALSLTVWSTALPSLNESRIGTAWSGSWTPGRFSDYYGKDYWANSTVKHQWYDLLIRSRTPPDAIYQSPSSLRDASDYSYLASRGVRWFAVLDVTTVPMAPLAAEPQRFHGKRVSGCPTYSDEYVKRLLDVLEPIVEALQAEGILDRAYVYGFDEKPASCEPQVRQLFGATKRRWPKLRTAAVLNWSPMPVDLPVDIWILQYQDMKAEDAALWTAAGKAQWQYHCIEPHSLGYPNTFLERRPIQARLLFWLAALGQLTVGAPTGWLYYEVNLWSPCKSDGCGGAHTPQVMRRMQFDDDKDPRKGFKHLAFTDFPPANYIWQPEYEDIFVNGDGQYLYPCEHGPCSTTRLAAIRDGLEDWELFAALGARAVPLIRRLVRSPSDWSEDAALLEATRREAAALLQESAATPSVDVVV